MEPVLLEAGFPPPPVARGRTLQSPQNHRSRSGGAGQPIKQEKVSTGQPRYSHMYFLWNVWARHWWCDDHRVIDNDVSEEERDGNDGNESYADDDDYDEGNLVDISEGRRRRLVGSVGRLLSSCEVVEGDLVIIISTLTNSSSPSSMSLSSFVHGNLVIVERLSYVNCHNHHHHLYCHRDCDFHIATVFFGFLANLLLRREFAGERTWFSGEQNILRLIVFIKWFFRKSSKSSSWTGWFIDFTHPIYGTKNNL